MKASVFRDSVSSELENATGTEGVDDEFGVDLPLVDEAEEDLPLVVAGGGGNAVVELIGGTGAFGGAPSLGANSRRKRIMASTNGYSPARSAGRSCEMREKRL